MGVPKFFRYVSERYPCLSELIKDYQIPEFDNLYLDMNGIIHNCSHPNDDDPHFRITEEKIFKDIFHYIEVLFRMIKPQKLFFMAVDGVAPRAKMNQQRGRRFRSAADAAKAEAEALKKGEQLPSEARFDSNCITPGTVFMARLHEQLKYFVVDKISNDPLWQKCKVILSGHETPGEGEHKIMDYIRYMRVQSGYDPNTRHCLYGLDADLMMLGLCTHEPHFSLLREEVKFGRKDTKRITVPEEITFFLLHLSLFREYLELEFAPVKYNLRNFNYDLEKIIDDWVLMGFLMGNDFIPHLPNLHISEGALPILYNTYMEVLPSMNGYINEGGKLNMERFETFLQKLGERDMLAFEEARDDILYMDSKRSKLQKDARCLEEFDIVGNNVMFESLEPTKDSGLEALLKSTDELCIDDELDESSDEDEFLNFKKDYYKQKLEYKDVTSDVLRDQAEGYVTAIQWNLNYYYNGCCSWSWFYPHHYAPYISDIQGFKDFKIEFDMGTPFHPYEQLLAVLPAASKKLLPECYHPLMTDENSIIIDYYPEKFECDLNGKKQAWEAVVKIPFIDEKLLLEAMSYVNDKLTTEERQRNSHGPMLAYMYTARNNGPYPAPCYFSEVPKNHTEVKAMMYTDILVPKEKLIKGAYPGAHMDTYYPGFPTMKHLKYKGELKMAHVKVFEQPSRNESMILKVIPEEIFSGDKIPVDLLGTSVYIGWPHLVEASVVSISNSRRKLVCMGGPNQYNANDMRNGDLKEFNMSISGITEYYKTRMGIDFGETKVLVHVKQLIGKKFVCNQHGKLVLEKQFAENTSCFPLQTIVYNITVHDPQSNVVKEVETIFPKNSICFTLANPFYGSQGVIQDSSQVAKTGRIKITISVLEEPDFSTVRNMFDNVFKKYKPAHSIATPLCMSNLIFSKLTGAIQVKVGEGNETKRINVGLDLKLNKKNKETPGYTKKVNNCWLYTEKTAELVEQYTEKFPEVLEFLSKNREDDIAVDKLFPVDSDERFKELRQWLKTLPTEKIEKSPCNSIRLESEAVAEMEKIVDSFKSNDKKITMQIKPSFLYRPEVQNGTLEPDPKTKTQILDRVVNVRHGFTVPFGFKGTVTAIRNSSTNLERDTMYEVVFDKPFRDGMTLNCSDNRGYMLPKTAFINISYGKRLMEEKIGKPDELMAKAESYNNQSNPFNDLIRPQPSFQQPCFPQHGPPLLVPQTHPTLNPSNSAFAHFTSMNAQRGQTFNIEQKSVQDFFNNLAANPESSTMENKNPIQIKTNDNQNKNAGWKRMDEGSVQQFFNNQLSGNRPGGNVKDVNNANVGAKVPTVDKDDQESWNRKNFYEKPRDDGSASGTTKKVPENWRSGSGVDRNRQQQQQQQQGDNLQQNRNNGVNYFMPTFRDGGKSETTDRKSRTATVNTDFLKNILGIGQSEGKEKTIQNKPPYTAKNPVATIPTLTSQANTVRNSSNVSFDMLAQVANTPATVRLLTYYQSNLLGLPRYQYFTVERNMVCAQITLNDGKIMIGQPAKNREEASEKVAAIVLDELLKKGKSVNQIVHKPNEVIPTPPVNWVQSENKENKEIAKHEKKPSESTTATSVLNNSFVPLQAVKSHISKSSGTQGQGVQIDNNAKQSVSSDKKYDVHDNAKQNQDQKNANGVVQRPKKERKTRIAANFLNKKN